MKRLITAAAFAMAVIVLSPKTPFAQMSSIGLASQPPGKLVDVGGYRLHINCAGGGNPTVVLIAGSGDFSFDWSLVQPAVSRFARVCSYDRAGLAWSDLGPTPRTISQDAFELHVLLKNARVPGPYVLVGHSIGGLIARVYAEQYRQEVAGIVLVDSTTEDTTLNYRGKLIHVRGGAKGRPVPAVQTMASSPPKPPTTEDIKQEAFNRQVFGASKIEPPFDNLPSKAQALRLWALSNPKLSAAAEDYFAEELQAMYEARGKMQYPLGDVPLVVLIGSRSDKAPAGISTDEWERLAEEKRNQKTGLASLSRNSEVIVAEKSGHHIQLDEPELVVSAIRRVMAAARRRAKLAP